MESGGNRFERTHLRRRDLDWMPGHWRAIQWGVAGTIWTAELAALIFASHSVPDAGGAFWGFTAGFFTAGWYAGGRAARMALRRKAQRMAGGKLDLSKLKNEEDGELVHVRGKVRAREQIDGWLGGRGVYQRLIFTIGQVPLVHEKLVDFTLVDESGETVWVQADGARLIGPEPRVRDVSEDVKAALMQLPLPEDAQKAVRRQWRRRVKASEYLVADGDSVEILGYKTRLVDISVERMERETPFRATLRSGKELPLLVIPA